MNPAALETLARRWRWRTLAREGLLLLGATGLATAAAAPWVRAVPWGPFLGLTVGVLVFRLHATRPWRIGPARVAAHLDRAHPELEESAGLWLRAPASLTAPERLQLRRLDAAWAGLSAATAREGNDPRRAPAGFWRAPVAVFTAGMLALAGAVAWRAAHPRAPLAAVGNAAVVLPSPAAAGPPANLTRPRLAGAELTVVPPAYTGRPPRTVVGLDAEVEEGATVSWRLRLEGDSPVQEARLVFETGSVPPVPLRETIPGAGWEGTRAVGADSGLYHVAVRLPERPAKEWRLPAVGSLRVIPDAPPVITLLRPAGARTELDPVADARTLPVEVRVMDDHGVRGARLVATVAKGSGEAVKFRERTLEFDPPAPAPADSPNTPRERRFHTTLDLVALGLEAGDELYFHVEAEDNHPPTAHLTRSETRFVILRGPETVPVAAGRGVAGVNLVPEYFRSERQIILDTERLLADRPGLPEREFRRRAEDLGADQALLRLRYGQFVGEEIEAGGVGGGDHAEVDLNPLRPGVPSGVPADLVHQHDRGAGETAASPANDPRAGLRTALRLQLEHADQARGGGGHDAGPAAPDAGLPPTAGQVLAPYVDQHDSQDKATFFDQGTKATLRGVLAEMWTAEGLLRTVRPEEALAPEHRALEGLKELQQGERLYVQRVGFEPAPLRVAERRGRGDVADVPERANSAAGAVPPTSDAGLATVRAALAALPGGDGRLAPAARAVLGAAAGALADAAARPGGDKFLDGLRALRRLEEDGENPAAPGDLATVRSALLRLLPPAEPRPERRLQAAPGLDRAGSGEVAEGGPRTP